ncbi:transcription termination/antitermination protein NusA [[Mycoplasma] mobile]|uniref:Transcription termination/antitermination protein NusA n=1 Tax=Mycoplasma mobile (strain ATCC 43663 / 163K / NCTC 11711) TaxID=267748 RepID=Q6KIE0_MYCM1|nr:transcription termination/antitermination protein NusA [[Mycoplasma] mobile]AAT27636.1 N-utilization substance protein a [Mycoplasma mobile 163K]
MSIKKEKTNEKLTIKDFFELVGSRADLSQKEVMDTLLNAITLIFNNDFDPNAKLDLVIEKSETGESKIKLYILNKLVTDYDVEEEEKYYSMNVENAKKINPSLEVNMTFKDEIPFESFSPSIFKKIYNVFTQSMKEFSKEYLISKYGNLKGQIIRMKIEGINITNNRRMVSLKLENENGSIEAFMPDKLQNPNIEMVIGDYVEVYVEDVKPDSRGLRVIVSNTSNEILKKLLELEIPEIASGNIVINAIKRIPGIRSKIAVSKTSFAPDGIDPMGAIVGQKGSRINKISDRLGGEKIDVILFDTNLEKFIINSISPASVAHISKINDEANNHFLVVVPDLDNTKAIGKAGQNVKLAAGLTETRLDILSVTQAKEKGIELLNNGNLDKSNFGNRRPSFSRTRTEFNNGHRSTSFNSIMEDFDKEVETYKTNILTLQDKAPEDFPSFLPKKNTPNSKNNKSIEFPQSFSSFNTQKEDTFSMEDLAKINSDFETDSDIASYDDFDMNNLDVDGADWD